MLNQKGEDGGIEIFSANIEAGKNCGSIAEVINLTFSDNLNKFDCWPAYTPEQYGDILVNQFLQDAHANAFNRLEKSEDPEDRSLAAHIEKLETHVDKAAFGREAAKEEGGVFTEQGYLIGGNDLQTFYRGTQDIPVCNSTILAGKSSAKESVLEQIKQDRESRKSAAKQLSDKQEIPKPIKPKNNGPEL